jgi:hypothetical protein
MREEMWGKQKQSPRLIPGRGDWIRACFMGESLPQADTRRRTEGTRGEAEEARSASLPSWHQTPARPCGGKRVCSGPTDRVFVGDRAPADFVSVTSGRVACSSSYAPRVGRGPAAGVRRVGLGRLTHPEILLTRPQVMGTPGLVSRCGLKTTATVEAVFRRLIPTPRASCSDQFGCGEITVWRGEVNG